MPGHGPGIFSTRDDGNRAEPGGSCRVTSAQHLMEATMGFGRGALLWMLGIPLPIILILALFMNR